MTRERFANAAEVSKSSGRFFDRATRDSSSSGRVVCHRSLKQFETELPDNQRRISQSLCA
jgi:hypothetical protein